jgi:hypothetical protein
LIFFNTFNKAAKFYSDLWEIDDIYRKKKYQLLFLSSLQNDMNKWIEELKVDKTRYLSPDYNGSKFIIEFRGVPVYSQFSYISHKSDIIPGRSSELIYDDFSGEVKTLITKLRETIYSPDIYEIEKLIGKQHDRKEKLIFLDLEQMKETVEEAYQDWLKNDTEVVAKMIAKIMYSYRKKEEFLKLWTDKFEGIELINNELKKLRG